MSNGGTPATEEPDAATEVPDAAAPRAPGNGAAWVFDEDQVRSYQFELSPSDWENLKAHARDEQYQAANLVVAGEVIGQVGLRFKGGLGTLFGCTDSAGNVLCPKLSMKVKFDEYEPGRRFHGLKRLNFRAIAEPSHLHERLGYRLFRQMGVTAPRAAHAWLSVNGEPLGLFAAVENIDGRFTDTHFEDGNGNLYKEQWPGSTALSRLQLETDDEAPDHSAMIQFVNDLAVAAPEDLPRVVATYMDVDHLFAYLAVDRGISNWDGITAFYCNNGGCRNHNQFLYQDAGAAHFTLIPWDLDNTFAPSSSFEYVPGPLVVPDDCSIHYRVYGDLRVLAPGCDPLLHGLALSDLGRYRAQQTRLLDGAFELAGLQAWVDAREAQLLPFVAADTHGPSVLEFRTAIAALRRNLGTLALRLRAERDGESSQSFRSDVTGTDFETATPLGVRLGVLGQAAPEGSLDVALGSEGALAGEHDLRLSFGFAESAELPSQWARFALRFDVSRAADLSATSALALVVQSDTPRTLRISFASSNYTQVQTGTTATLGWDVVLDGTRQEIELPLASAAFPESGRDLTDTHQSVLTYATALLFDPLPKQLAADAVSSTQVDAGQIRIDDIRLLP